MERCLSGSAASRRAADGRQRAPGEHEDNIFYNRDAVPKRRVCPESFFRAGIRIVRSERREKSTEILGVFRAFSHDLQPNDSDSRRIRRFWTGSMERCLSGLKRRSRKPLYPQGYREFESHPLRHIKSLRNSGGFLCATWSGPQSRLYVAISIQALRIFQDCRARAGGVPRTLRRETFRQRTARDVFRILREPWRSTHRIY